jgi:predicted Zn-ribbon and HTH transcriptional regulator
MIDIEKQLKEIIKERQAILPPGVEEIKPITATFWVVIQPLDQKPYVITKRAVDKKWMPPDGKSALPKVIRRQIPSEFQYWKEKGKKAQEVRDNLVQAIKDKEVEIDIDILKKDYDLKKIPLWKCRKCGFELNEKREVMFDRLVTCPKCGEAMLEIEKQESGKFVLQFHWYRGAVIVRRGASEYHFDFRAYFGKIPFDHWVLEENPLEQPEGVSATFKSCRDLKTLEVEYNPPPKESPLAEYKKRSIPFGTSLNPTKATPAFTQKIDSGKVIKLIDKPLFKKYQVTTGKMKGLWIVERKTPTEKIWKFSKSALPRT